MTSFLALRASVCVSNSPGMLFLFFYFSIIYLFLFFIVIIIIIIIISYICGFKYVCGVSNSPSPGSDGTATWARYCGSDGTTTWMEQLPGFEPASSDHSGTHFTN